MAKSLLVLGLGSKTEKTAGIVLFTASQSWLLVCWKTVRSHRSDVASGTFKVHVVHLKPRIA